MRQLVYSVRYSTVQITSSLSNITYFSVRTTLIYYDTKYLVHFTMLYMGLTVIVAMTVESVIICGWEVQ